MNILQRCLSSFLSIIPALPFTSERLVTTATVTLPHMAGYLWLEQQAR